MTPRRLQGVVGRLGRWCVALVVVMLLFYGGCGVSVVLDGRCKEDAECTQDGFRCVQARCQRAGSDKHAEGIGEEATAVVEERPQEQVDAGEVREALGEGQPDDAACQTGEVKLCFDAQVGCREEAGKLVCRGVCKPGERRCVGGRWASACVGAILPSAEVCDGKDNDCDGVIDEDAPRCVRTLAGKYQAPGDRDGDRAQAMFRQPGKMALDAKGNLYIIDMSRSQGARSVRKIDVASGKVSTLHSGSSLNHIAVDALGNVYVTSSNFSIVKRIDTLGKVTNFTDYNEFKIPMGLAIDATGEVYVADMQNHRIRKVDKSGKNITTFAGSGVYGYRDGPALQAQFHYPKDLALDGAGNLYVLESIATRLARVRKIDTKGLVTTIKEIDAISMTVDADGEVYITDLSHRVRKIDAKGKVTTLAGTGKFGTKDGPALQATFFFPAGIVVVPDGTVYLADTENHRIRKLGTDGQVSTFAGNGIPPAYRDGPADFARFNQPVYVAVDSSGNVYVTEGNSPYNNWVRKIDAAGNVSTFVGSEAFGFLDDTGQKARFNMPLGLAIDPTDHLYIADRLNGRIRKVDPSGKVTTFAGTGEFGYRDGPANKAILDRPERVFWVKGELFVAEVYGSRIRKIDANGQVTTLPDNAQSRMYSKPMAKDAKGNLYTIADNQIIQTSPQGVRSVFAGTKQAGFLDGPAAQAMFSAPADLSIDSKGNLYVADRGNHRIRMITP